MLDISEQQLLPDETPLLLEWPDLQPIVRFSRSTLHREINAGRFPQPIHTAAQKTAWVRKEVEQWLSRKIAARSNA